MNEVRPGLLRTRKVRVNRFEKLERTVKQNTKRLEHEVEIKYHDNKEAVTDLQGLAQTVTGYVRELRKKGIDVDYINEHAEQIASIFFAVMELLKNGADEETTQATVEAIAEKVHG